MSKIKATIITRVGERILVRDNSTSNLYITKHSSGKEGDIVKLDTSKCWLMPSIMFAMASLSSENLDNDVDMMKSVADAIINKYKDCFVLFANIHDNHVNIIAKSNTDKVNCGLVVKDLSIKCKGNGGGSITFAQGGGSDATLLSKHLENIKENIKNNK